MHTAEMYAYIQQIFAIFVTDKYTCVRRDVRIYTTHIRTFRNRQLCPTLVKIPKRRDDEAVIVHTAEVYICIEHVYVFFIAYSAGVTCT